MTPKKVNLKEIIMRKGKTQSMPWRVCGMTQKRCGKIQGSQNGFYQF